MYFGYETMNKLTEIPSVKIYAILLAMLGNDKLINSWWNTPNKAFDNLCPKDADEFKVLSYLLSF